MIAGVYLSRFIRSTLIAAASIALLAVVFRVFVTSYAGQAADQSIMRQAGVVTGHDLPTSGLLAQVQLPALAVIGAAIAVICAVRRSWVLLAKAGSLILVTTAAAIVLKSGLQRPSMGFGALTNSFPSNTVATFAAATLALLMTLPPVARRVAAPLGLLCLTGIAIAVVALQWHRPSDVVGGILLAVAVSAGIDALSALMSLNGRALPPSQPSFGNRSAVPAR